MHDSLYKERTDLYQSQIGILKQRLGLIALLRMIVFVILATCIYAYFKDRGLIFLYAACCFLILFIVVIKINFQIRDKKSLYEQLLFVNSNESGILVHHPNQFDNGELFRAQEKYFEDLDIFGERSVFHLLNRTTTSHGREQLAAMLKKPLLDKKDIERYQQAVKILSQQFENRQLLIAHGLLHEEKEGNLYSISEWLGTDNQLHRKKWLLILRWLLPAYNLIATFYLLTADIFLPVIIGVIGSWTVLGFFGKYISKQHVLISKKQQVLDQYKAILQIFNQG